MAASFEMTPCVRLTIGNPAQREPPFTMIPAIQAFMEWMLKERVHPLRGTCSSCGWYYSADFKSEDQFRIRNFLKTVLPEVK